MLFGLVSLSGGYDTHYCLALSEAMTNDESSQFEAHAQKDEAIFVFRVVRIIEPKSAFVIEDGTCFIERNAVFPDVCPFFLFLPLES
jgi:hypothetical protein